MLALASDKLSTPVACPHAAPSDSYYSQHFMPSLGPVLSVRLSRPAGWLFAYGAIDFAGGMVIHVSSGVSALVLTTWLGGRWKPQMERPHNVPFVVLGAALLWFGWFGFNAGSAVSAGASQYGRRHKATVQPHALHTVGMLANPSSLRAAPSFQPRAPTYLPTPPHSLCPDLSPVDPHATDPPAGYGAGLAFTNTQLAPAMAMLTWALLEIACGAEGWGKGRPTAVGAATAAVVGLVGVTPAAGFVAPMWALFIGALRAADATASGD